MLLRDFIQKNNLWAGIKTEEEFPFIESPVLMDARTLVDYGERTISKAFESLESELVYQLIVSKFYDKWNKLVLIELEKINLLSDVTSSEIKTGTSNKDSTKQDIIKNKVSGYNSPDLITEGGNDNNSSGNDSIAYSEEILKGNYSISTLYENLKDYQKTNIIETTVKDVVNYITLSIY